MDSAFIITIAALGIILLVGLVTWLKRIRGRRGREPIIELEKLVHCRSCDSLIPEGVSKCAFCGASQGREGSGEQIRAS
jgi:hypothetical protein